MSSPATRIAGLAAASLWIALCGCAEQSPTRDGESAPLRVELRFPSAASPDSTQTAAGGVPVDLDAIEICAREIATGAGAREVECASAILDESAGRFSASLRVPAPASYRVEARATGVRGSSNLTERGVLFFGQAEVESLEAGSARSVGIEFSEITPFLSLSTGDLVHQFSWSPIPGAGRYRFRAVPTVGDVIEETTSSTTFELPFAVLRSRGASAAPVRYACRVRAELSDDLVSAYSESIGVTLEQASATRIAGFAADPRGTRLRQTLVKLFRTEGGLDTDTGLQRFTDADGEYAFEEVEPGTYALLFIRGGCGDLRVPLVGGFDLDPDETFETRPATLECAPIFASFTVSWDDDPFDLDAHLWTPEMDSVAYHVSFVALGSATTAPFAQLDRDDTDGFGPEQVNIYQARPGVYLFAVLHYPSVLDTPGGTLRSANARVQILVQDAEPIELTLPAGEVGTNWWWLVCEIDGSTGAVTVLDELVADPNRLVRP
mgnify:CR=1 FL=1